MSFSPTRIEIIVHIVLSFDYALHLYESFRDSELGVHDTARRGAYADVICQYDEFDIKNWALSHTTNGTVEYMDAVTEVAHSVRTYKGKIFLLVRRE